MIDPKAIEAARRLEFLGGCFCCQGVICDECNARLAARELLRLAEEQADEPTDSYAGWRVIKQVGAGLTKRQPAED